MDGLLGEISEQTTLLPGNVSDRKKRQRDSIEPVMSTEQLVHVRITGMTCASCVAAIEGALMNMKGMSFVVVCVAWLVTGSQSMLFRGSRGLLHYSIMKM